MTDAAVEISKKRHQRQIANYEFLVVGPPDECPGTICDEAIWVNLDDEAFLRKVVAARGYNSKLALDIDSALGGQPFTGVRRFSEPQLAGDADKSLSAAVELALRSNPEMVAKVKGAFDGVELHRFHVECLRPIDTLSAIKSKPSEIPFYELYGEKMVTAGHYETTIRYADHFRPLAEAVYRYVENYS